MCCFVFIDLWAEPIMAITSMVSVFFLGDLSELKGVCAGMCPDSERGSVHHQTTPTSSHADQKTSYTTFRWATCLPGCRLGYVRC